MTDNLSPEQKADEEAGRVPTAPGSIASGDQAASHLVPSGNDPIARDALISPCGQYRYWLTREWDAATHNLPIIMLNPSTADAVLDDRTIGRCMEFARREGFGGIRVMNLFAFRATSPDDMRRAVDPIGPENEMSLIEMMALAGEDGVPILAAWGSHGEYRGRGPAMADRARFLGAKLVCLGTTKEGHPRHPLYVKGDQPLVPFAQAMSAGTAETEGLGPKDESAVPQGCAQPQQHPESTHD